LPRCTDPEPKGHRGSEAARFPARWRQFTGEEVIAGPAVEHIITRTASHEVVPGASQQFIPAETPDDRVRPVATVADIIAEG